MRLLQIQEFQGLPARCRMKQRTDLADFVARRGGIVVSEPITLPPPAVDLSVRLPSKWEREHQAFLRLLPHLLVTHRRQFVAIHEGRVVDSGDDKLALALRVLTKVGNVAVHIGRVTEEPEPVSRSGIRRELRASGDAS
jgi:hypothetical protein